MNALTGEGLARVLAGADVVVDVSNSPSFEDAAVLDFFERSGRNLLAAEREAGVKHHVALSIVGTDRLAGNGYFLAKVAQERLIATSGLPTPSSGRRNSSSSSRRLPRRRRRRPHHCSDADFQPIAAADVAAALADLAPAPPRNTTIEIAGRTACRSVTSSPFRSHQPATVGRC